MVNKNNKYLKQYSGHIVKYLHSQYKKRGVSISQDALKTIQGELEEEVIKITHAAVSSLIAIIMAGLLKGKEFTNFTATVIDPNDGEKLDSKSSGYLLKMIKADKTITSDLVSAVHTMLCSQMVDTKQIDMFLESVDNMFEDEAAKKRMLTLGINNIFMCCVWGHRVKYKDIDFDMPSNIVFPPPISGKAPVN